MRTRRRDERVLNPVAGEYLSAQENGALVSEFRRDAILIVERHLAQDADDVQRLTRKYSQPVLGTKPIASWLKDLALCYDPADVELGCVSQLTHALQVASALERDGYCDEFVVTGLVHDLGKLLLLKGEDAANVSGPNEVLGDYEEGVGLMSTTIHWNHDQFIFDRLGHCLPEEFAWLLRHHSLRCEAAEVYMNEADKHWVDSLLLPFRHYDLRTKSPHMRPGKDLSDYAELLGHFFPGNVSL